MSAFAFRKDSADNPGAARLAYRLIYAAMLACTTLLVVAIALDHRLPAPARLSTDLTRAPLQQDTSLAPFERRIGGMTYRIVPVASYDLNGLIVSEHDTLTWWDWIHKAAGDFINTIDVCVVWGNNAAAGVYQHVHFSSSEFTCDWNYREDQLNAPFRIEEISNNHLLTDNPRLAHALRDLRVGDQIHFKGLLVNYANVTLYPNDAQAYRNTSTTRYDSGPGACEVVFVNDLEVLRRASRWWSAMKVCCVGGLVLCAALWLALPYRPEA